MSILSGFIKARSRKKTTDGYMWETRDTHSDTVIMPDGNTATTNIGNIYGITDSLESTSSNIAASAKSVKTLINSNLGGLSFVVLTQAEYTALTTKGANTIYFIKA